MKKLNPVKRLEINTQRLKNKINGNKLCIVRDHTIGSVIKSGIVIDYAIPFVFAGMLIASLGAENGETPFIKDIHTEQASLETIDTSTGIHFERYWFDDDTAKFYRTKLEYSTGWIIDENGLYERNIITYEVSDKIDLSNIDKVFNMSKEELENSITEVDRRTIRKTSLTPEECVYKEDAFIIFNYKKSDQITRTVEESTIDNIWYSFLFILFVAVLGGIISTKNLFIKSPIRETLKKYKAYFERIKKEENEPLKELLRKQQMDLARITNPETFDADKLYPRSLRKELKP